MNDVFILHNRVEENDRHSKGIRAFFQKHMNAIVTKLYSHSVADDVNIRECNRSSILESVPTIRKKQKLI